MLGDEADRLPGGVAARGLPPWAHVGDADRSKGETPEAAELFWRVSAAALAGKISGEAGQHQLDDALERAGLGSVEGVTGVKCMRDETGVTAQSQIQGGESGETHLQGAAGKVVDAG